jgi:hypothetical protein
MLSWRGKGRTQRYYFLRCTVHSWVFPGGKERPGRNADPSPPSSAVGHERVELYLHSPYGACCLYRASVSAQGCTLALPLRYTVVTQNIHLICLSVNESPSGYLLNYKWATLRLICYTTVPLPMTDNFIRIVLKPLVVFERLMQHHAIV